MTRIPSLSIPWFDGDKITFEGPALYYLVLALLVLCYLGLRILVNSRFGNVLVAIRENPERAELLGYDIRRYQLVAFIVGSTLAGLSGVLYTAWGQFIVPAVDGASGGRHADHLGGGRRAQGPHRHADRHAVRALAVPDLIVISQQYALIVIGALLLVTILFMPGGYIVWLVENRDAIFNWRRRRAQRAAQLRAAASDGAAE